MAFFSPHWARMLSSMPEIKPLTVGEQYGKELGADGTELAMLVARDSVVHRDINVCIVGKWKSRNKQFRGRVILKD